MESRDDFVDVDGRTHEEVLAELGYWPIDINGELIDDVRARIYIEVARELKADETPELLLFGGGVYDLAGNANESENKETQDGIAPRFTITVTAVTPGEVPASAGTTGTSAGTTGEGRPRRQPPRRVHRRRARGRGPAPPPGALLHRSRRRKGDGER